MKALHFCSALFLKPNTHRIKLVANYNNKEMAYS